MGDGNNSMFTMDTNGTLRTAMSFDYESYQSLNISVVVLDDSNASEVGSFSVAVTNVNETAIALDHLSALTVFENQVSGTIVGTFQAQDPDGIHYITTWPAEWEMEIIVCLPWIRMVHCELRCHLIMNRIKV